MFRNIRLWPQIGAQELSVTWETSLPGDVFVAISKTGAPDSWTPVNEVGVPAATGVLVINQLPPLEASVSELWIMLLIENAGDPDVLSEPIRLHDSINPREVGVIRGILRRHFQKLQARNGFPVWHCVPLTEGVQSSAVDPDTQEMREGVCDPESYGMPFVGGFHPPLLTWVEIVQSDKGTITDNQEGLGSTEPATLQFRMFPFPKPARNHMLVCPMTDRRYVLGDKIKGNYFRGNVVPVMFRVDALYLYSSDARYNFPVPELDVMNYRKMPYWNIVQPAP